MQKTFHIFTYGCQMNKSDSEILSGILIKNGYLYTKDREKADILIFNTCAVRGNAENRAFGRLKEFNARRKKNKNEQILVVSGCVPQYEKENIFKLYPFIDIALGANSYEQLPEIINKNFNQKLIINENKIINNFDKYTLRIEQDQAFIPIAYGCDNFCSYCIVPYTRGREISRPKEDILAEISRLEFTPLRKIMLLGQNVNSYGKGLYVDYNFADLLQEIILKFSWLKQIDFLTSHPKDITAQLIQVISEHAHIGREIHFPAQHANNRILTLMNRGYSIEDYKAKVIMIREKVPKAKISTDLIVGFPSETEQDFQELIQLLQDIRFFRVNTAAYSPRKGTKAAEMDGQIPEKIKHERLLALNEAVKQFAFKMPPL